MSTKTKEGITFEPFRRWAEKNKIPRMELREKCGFGSKTAAKVWNDHLPVRSDTIETLCRVYGLRIEEVVEYRRKI